MDVLKSSYTPLLHNFNKLETLCKALNRQTSELADKSSQPAAFATNPYDNIKDWPGFKEKPNISLAYAFFQSLGASWSI
jgi:hypothetical protein